VQVYNDGFAVISGGKHPAAMGVPTFDVWPEAREITEPLYRRVLDAGESITLHDQLFQLMRGDAPEDTYLTVSYSPVRDDDGRIAGILATVFETTAKILAERNRLAAVLQQERLLREVEAGRSRLADVFMRSPAFMCMMTGPGHVYEMANEQYDRLVAHRPLIGRTVREALPEIDGQGFFELLDRVYATGEPFVGTAVPVELQHRSGAPPEVRYLDFVYQAMRDADGAAYGIFVHGVDVTDHVRAREALEQASRAKDQFLAVLSHELRTPLTPVVMTVAALEHAPELPPKFRDDLAMVRRNVELESKLIDDLLDLSRVTAGKLPLHPQPVRVHGLIRHVADSCRSDTFGKRLRFELDLAAADDVVRADPARLQQVIWNLVRNSIKFTPEHGTITIRTRNEGRVIRGDGQGEGGLPSLVVEITDTGIGIAADVLPLVFNAFEQGDLTQARQFGGLGLGLAIAKAIVELHDGRVAAASPGRGRGSTFTVELPTAPAPARLRAPAPTPAAVRGRAAPVRVLLVEDHADTRRTLARLLASAGYDVKAADSAADALALADAHGFDVMLSDIGLPDATGYDLMRQVRDRHAIPGVALSGYGMEDDLRRGREAGFVDHIVKPVNVAHLESVLARVTAGTTTSSGG
jgi:signal transduction histidine kinase/ActR/RegA family two-component response regulator